jgi:2-hydroxy-4-carboxymuconate semialdehyde hemiacetal dehydrogenase
VNICMVGHGMMGTWHSEALAKADVNLHTLVGVLPEPTAAFAARHGYTRWSTDFHAVLRDSEIDVAVLATPSELHAAQAITALDHGKHVLCEIPIAMDFADAERVVAAARRSGKVFGMNHPRRFGADRAALCQRVRAGTEHVRLVDTRFFIHRLSNVGATGLKRDWTDNLLWHHVTHLIDFGLWISTGGDLAAVGERIRDLATLMGSPDQNTKIPMEAALMLATRNDQTIVCTGSYYSRGWIYDLLVVTDRETYRFDELKGTMTTSAGEFVVESQQHQCEMVVADFLAAVRQGREPAVPGWSVLPAMAVLERAQEDWDRRYGRQSLPGRPLSEHS